MPYAPPLLSSRTRTQTSTTHSFYYLCFILRCVWGSHWFVQAGLKHATDLRAALACDPLESACAFRVFQRKPAGSWCLLPFQPPTVGKALWGGALHGVEATLIEGAVCVCAGRGRVGWGKGCWHPRQLLISPFLPPQSPRREDTM